MTEAVILLKRVHWFVQQNQWTGFYMITASVMKELSIFVKSSEHASIAIFLITTDVILITSYKLSNAKGVK